MRAKRVSNPATAWCGVHGTQYLKRNHCPQCADQPWEEVPVAATVPQQTAEEILLREQTFALAKLLYPAYYNLNGENREEK